MLFSKLMSLPNWNGTIYIPKHDTKVQLTVAVDGSCLTFKHRGKYYNLEDQVINMADDGDVFVRIKSRNRKLFHMPTGIHIKLVDRNHNTITPGMLYRLEAHKALMA